MRLISSSTLAGGCNTDMNKRLMLALIADILGAASQTFAQSVPNVVSPQAAPIPGAVVTQGLTWTPPQWDTAFAGKKDILVFWKLTSGATAVQLTTDGNTASTVNVGSIPTSTAVEYSAQCLILDRTSRKGNVYTVAASAISNISGTVAVGGSNPSVVAGPTLASGLTLGAVPTFTADNTNKGWNISYTPPSGNTDPVFAQCTVEVLVVN
jgi:hypothetical protein